ncbi:MAG TPA: DUF929 family protein [Acidimicrobiales bacterium]|jgi:hypothetical protein
MALDVHEHAAAPVVHTIPRRYVALGLIVVAIILLGALLLIRHDLSSNSPNGATTAETFNPSSTGVVNSVTQIPKAVVDAVGVTSPGGPTSAPAPAPAVGGGSGSGGSGGSGGGGSPIWQASSHGVVDLPVVFFYGAEFSPYAAAERWALIAALSRFGTFGAGSIGDMTSSASIAFPTIESFTFSHTTYRSIWLSLQTVERYSSLDPTGGQYTALQTLSAHQAIAVASYDTSDSTFPFLDIANRYVQVGSGFSPSVLQGLSQSEIASALSDPTSPVTQSVVAAANEITAAICTVTGNRPVKACDARGVEAANDKMGIAASG